MKKLDKLIIRSFIGPFVLTFAIVEFILLTAFMLRHLEELLGKDLGIGLFGELLFYFSLNMVPVALPLAVLLAALMTFGTLGEHHELTAIKTSGVALPRILRPVFLLVLVMAAAAFFFNDKVVPTANLKAFSLLYDIKVTKPTLNLKEGAFYQGIPNYSIKVNEKMPDGETLRQIMIYDHTAGAANTKVILADSGKMYMHQSEQYLVLELFKGNTYVDQSNGAFRSSGEQFARQKFDESKIILSLAAFGMGRTDETYFTGNKQMKDIRQLGLVTDSLRNHAAREKQLFAPNVNPFYTYFRADTTQVKNGLWLKGQELAQELPPSDAAVLAMATNKARSIKAYTESYKERLAHTLREANNFEIEIWRKYTQSVTIVILFLIGAPLGAIIKKGGLGLPVIISIVFFIILYVLGMLGEKWGREGLTTVEAGMWAANAILLPVGLFFLYQARNDSSLLDVDFWQKLVLRLRRR